MRKFDAFATKRRRTRRKMKELNLKNMKIREMFERIMRLEDEVAEFQRSDMEGEEE